MDNKDISIKDLTAKEAVQNPETLLKLIAQRLERQNASSDQSLDQAVIDKLTEISEYLVTQPFQRYYDFEAAIAAERIRIIEKYTPPPTILGVFDIDDSEINIEYEMRRAIAEKEEKPPQEMPFHQFTFVRKIPIIMRKHICALNPQLKDLICQYSKNILETRAESKRLQDSEPHKLEEKAKNIFDIAARIMGAPESTSRYPSSIDANMPDPNDREACFEFGIGRDEFFEAASRLGVFADGRQNRILVPHKRFQDYNIETDPSINPTPRELWITPITETASEIVNKDQNSGNDSTGPGTTP